MNNIYLRELTQQVTQPVFFITPDINWALGLEDNLPNYNIICLEDHPMIELLKKNNVNVLCLQKDHPT